MFSATNQRPRSGNTLTLSNEEIVLGAVVSKEGHADSHLGHHKAYHYWLFIRY